MGDFICDELFNIKSAKLKWLVKFLFWVIGAIPYATILFGVIILAQNILDLKDLMLFSLPNIFISLACAGGCALWFLFCKIFKVVYFFLNA